jgi:SEC-C motif
MSAKIGRNSPCPCGSGRKYKRCCLDKDERESREQPAADSDRNTKIWYPGPDDLQLPDVPDALRPEARRVLGNALPLMFERGIGVRARACWEVAQALTRAAKGELGYVEGVWTRAPENKYRTPDDDINPVSHAWNAYQGRIINLVAEFYNWNSFGEDSPWLHEPLREYSFEDLRNFDKEELADIFSDGSETVYAISLPICLEGRYTEYFANFDFGIDDIEPVWKDENYLFKDARARLLARLSASKGAAAA